MKHTENSQPGPDQIESEGPIPSALIITLNLVFLFYTNLMVRLLISPLFLTIQEDLGITKAAAGQFFLFLAMGFFITMLLSSIPASTLGHRQTILFSSLSTTLGALFIGLSGGASGIKIGFLFIGVGSGLYLPSGVATITEVSGRQKAPSRIALHEMAPTVAFITIPIIVNGLLTLMPWRFLFIVIGGLHLLMGLVFIFLGSRLDFRGKPVDPGFIVSLIRQRRFWVITVYFVLFYGSMLGVFSILPTFLASEKGMGLEQANFVTGLTRLSIIPSLMAVGWFIRKTTTGQFIGVVFFFGGIAMAATGLSQGPLLYLFLFLQPGILAIFPTMGYLFLERFGPPESRVQSTMISIIIPFAFLFGNGVFPTVLTWLADRGLFSQGFIAYGIILAVSPVVYFLVLGHDTYKKPG